MNTTAFPVFCLPVSGELRNKMTRGAGGEMRGGQWGKYWSLLYKTNSLGGRD